VILRGVNPHRVHNDHSRVSSGWAGGAAPVRREPYKARVGNVLRVCVRIRVAVVHDTATRRSDRLASTHGTDKARVKIV